MSELKLPTSKYADPLTALLGRVSFSDARAFAELHALTKSKMRKVAIAAGAASSDVDDIVQEAYLKIWRHARSFDHNRASAITWMCAVVRNTAIDALRVRKLPAADLEEAHSIASPPDPSEDDGFDYAYAEPIASKVLERLPEQKRQLITLAYIDGESRAKLSQRFGVPVGTIKTWLRRSMQSVRQECLAIA